MGFADGKRDTHRGSKITLLYILEESSMFRVMFEHRGALSDCTVTS